MTNLNGTCPTCGKDGYDYEPMEYSDEDTATERVTCEDGHAWVNTWRLAGPPVPEPPAEPEPKDEEVES